MRDNKGTSLMLLLLYGLLILALLLLTVAGARLYDQALASHKGQSRQRGALSYIQSQAALCQGAGQIRLEAGPEGPMLCLSEPDSDYETRIYQYAATLRTEFSRREQPVTPENSEAVCALDRLELSWIGDTLLSVTADGRQAWVWCRGGAAYD